MHTQEPPTIPFPEGWPVRIKSAVLHIISLAHFSITNSRGWAANSINFPIGAGGNPSPSDEGKTVDSLCSYLITSLLCQLKAFR